jgi:hypothetical protein
MDLPAIAPPRLPVLGEIGVLGAIGAVAVAAVVIAWLAASFLRAGPARDRVAWVGAIGLYVALLCFFVNLTLRAWARDSTAGCVGFGFLTFAFAVGLAVAVVKAIVASRGGDAKDLGATH